MSAKDNMGKEFVVIVELYMDRCVNVYGTAPCTASVGVTGTEKCFNTLRSCQDVENYDRGDTDDRKVYRFATTDIPGLQQAGDPPTFPTLRGVETAPTKLDPGKGLGVRSAVSMVVSDHPWTDVGCDPYRRERTYDPDQRGSFWGKWLARNPNYEGRRVDILTGYLVDGVYDAGNFQRRTYLLTKVAGPDSNGQVSIEAKDPLKLADADKAQFPVATKAKLSAEMLIGDTLFLVADADGYIAAQYSDGQVYVRIDNEIMRITSIVDDGGGFYTVMVSRTDSPAIYNNALNIQVSHELGAAVQPCYYFNNVRIDQIVHKLLTDGTRIPATYLPASEWADAILGAGYDNYTFTALLATPEPVRDLITELTQHGILLWWDERDQTVSMKALVPQAYNGNPLNEQTNIIAGSIAVSQNATDRVSQVWMYFGLKFPTLDMTQLVNYANIEVKEDADAESDEEYGQTKILPIYSRWMPTAKRSVANEIGQRLLQSYRDTKIQIALSLDPKDNDAWTGDIRGVETDLVQDLTGLPVSQNYLVMEVSEEISDSGVTYAYLLQSDITLRRAGVITPNEVDGDPFPDYDDATDEQKLTYAFIGPNSGNFPDGEPPYEIL